MPSKADGQEVWGALDPMSPTAAGSCAATSHTDGRVVKSRGEEKLIKAGTRLDDEEEAFDACGQGLQSCRATPAYPIGRTKGRGRCMAPSLGMPARQGREWENPCIADDGCYPAIRMVSGARQPRRANPPPTPAGNDGRWWSFAILSARCEWSGRIRGWRR